MFISCRFTKKPAKQAVFHCEAEEAPKEGVHEKCRGEMVEREAQQL